jgi:beta-glucosidase
VTTQRFPADFVWGVATSAPQIEGGWREGGRGESVWDRFAATPGKISDGSTAHVACDHYHRWREDLDLMRWLGVDAYRFSVGWSRVLPTGRGEASAAGLDFYDALVDALLEAGIAPHVTLNHWDMPQALQDAGGWPARETARWFAHYAAVVAQRLGDRVRHWTTHNEPWCVATLGYEQGEHAPGLRDPELALRAAHHLLLSHGWASRVIRDRADHAEVGIVLNLSPGQPATDTPADREAARRFDGFFNRWYLDPLLRGEYPADAVGDRVRRGHLAGPVLPFVNDDDLVTIAAPLDFLGVNYYSRTVLAAGPDGEPRAEPPVPSDQLTEMGWEVYPDGLVEVLERVTRDYGVPSLYVTENGAAYVDPAPEDGRIADPRRVDYLRTHLAAAHRALERGVPLRGYFAWSLLDNWEWGQGYTRRFGLFGVDFATGRRIPKDSAHWYRAAIAARAVDPAP